jgi:hypothetical protein
MPTQEQHQWLAGLGVTGLVDRVEDAASTVASGVAQAVQDAEAGASTVGNDLAQAASAAASTARGIAGDVTSGVGKVVGDITQTAKHVAQGFQDNADEHQQPEQPDDDRSDPETTIPRPMQPDCKVVHGKVPGPANHVMCGTHGHILDTSAKQIIANDLADYQQRYGKGKSGGDTPTPPDPTGPLEPGDVALVSGKKYVIYADEVRQGGTVSWLCRNPGNIRSGERYGAFKGKKYVTDSVGAFAIFPDEGTGHAAILKLLNDYGHITILDTMKKYAPTGDGKNNPDAYAASVAKRIGVSVDTYLDELSEAQKQRFAAQIKQVEGWKAGSSFTRDDAKLPDEIKQRLQ